MREVLIHNHSITKSMKTKMVFKKGLTVALEHLADQSLCLSVPFLTLSHPFISFSPAPNSYQSSLRLPIYYEGADFLSDIRKNFLAIIIVIYL